MKKTLKMAVAASVLTVPAFASGVPGQINTTLGNISNPLYLPAQNMFYSKLSNSVRLKVADDTDAQKLKHHDGDVEFPIIRIQEDMGYGITDRWAVHFGAQYTHDEDVDRTGLSMGRLGTTYRVLNTNDGWVWDLYGDLHLGGIGKMRGQYNMNFPDMSKGYFDYDNFSTGMWGFHAGTKFGRVWNNRLTTSGYVEILHEIGNDNNEIRLVGANTAAKGILVNPSVLTGMAIPAPNAISVELKSLTDVNAGLDAFYQLTDRWSVGGGFHYEHHGNNGVKEIKTDLGGLEALKPQFEKMLKNMHDGFDDYIITVSVANQVTEHAQVALFAEYVFDTAHSNSQNGTDLKAEAGVRVNVQF